MRHNLNLHTVPSMATASGFFLLLNTGPVQVLLSKATEEQRVVLEQLRLERWRTKVCRGLVGFFFAAVDHDLLSRKLPICIGRHQELSFMIAAFLESHDDRLSGRFEPSVQSISQRLFTPFMIRVRDLVLI